MAHPIRSGGDGSAGKRPKRQLLPSRKAQSQPKRARIDDEAAIETRSTTQVRKRTKRDPVQERTHGMKTRRRAGHFRLMELPPELRVNILEHLFSRQGYQKLDKFRVPAIMQVNHHLRKEAAPIFFASTLFKTVTSSNWWVGSLQDDDRTRVGHSTVGKVLVSKALPNPEAEEAITEATFDRESVQFCAIEIRVTCTNSEKTIRRVSLKVENKTPSAQLELNIPDNRHTSALRPIDEAVTTLVASIGDREGFTGFTVADIQAVARCFKVEV